MEVDQSRSADLLLTFSFQLYSDISSHGRSHNQTPTNQNFTKALLEASFIFVEETFNL